MPPKSSTSSTAKATKSDTEASEAIDTYFAQKPDFSKLVEDAKEIPSRPRTDLRQTEYSRKVKEAVREVLEERRAQAKQRSKSIKMPKDNEPESHEVEKSLHDTGSSDTKQKATVEHHKANPGPVMGQDLGQPASKEELRKRAEELNKK